MTETSLRVYAVGSYTAAFLYFAIIKQRNARRARATPERRGCPHLERRDERKFPHLKDRFEQIPHPKDSPGPGARACSR